MVSIGKTTTITDPSGNVIANVDAIVDISISADEIEDTVYSTDKWKTFVQGLKDGGTFDLTVNYDKDSSGNVRLTSAFMAGTSGSYVIAFPDTTTFTFTAFVSGVGIAVPKDEKVQRTFTMRIDGKTPPVFDDTV